MTEMLIRLNIDPQVRLTRVYVESIRMYKDQQHLATFYDIFKAILGFGLAVYLQSQGFGCKWYETWLFVIMAVSFVSFLVNKFMADALNKLTTIVDYGLELDMVVYVDYDDDDIGELIDETDLVVNSVLDPYIGLSEKDFKKKAKWLAFQLRDEILRNNRILNVASKVTFYMNQLLLGSLIAILITQNNVCEEKKFWMVLCYMYAFLLLTFVQYMEFYLTLTMFILLSPLILIYFGYLAIKTCRNSRQMRATLSGFKRNSQKYSFGLVQGDQDCRICMSTYNIGEEVLVLPCNKLHHFHSKCIISWLRVTQNCPLCRQQIVLEDRVQEGQDF